MPQANSLLPYATNDEVRRFFEHVYLAPTGHWIWLGSTNPGGYGTFNIGKRKGGAHRLSWELRNGPIPKDLVIDHLCRTPRCVNPDHLEPVTQAENLRRGMSPTWTAIRDGKCRKGHPITDPTNLWIGPTGERKCRACMKLNRKQRWEAHKTRFGIPDARIAGTCQMEECGAKHYARGLCRQHYDANRRGRILEASR
jgi:hypothetical protein